MEKKKVKIIIPIVVVIILLVMVILIVLLNKSNTNKPQDNPKEKIVTKEFQYNDNTIEFGTIQTAVDSPISEDENWILEDYEKGFRTQTRVLKTSIKEKDFIKYYIMENEMKYSYYDTKEESISCNKDFTCYKITYHRKEPVMDSADYEEKSYVEVVAFHLSGENEYLVVSYTADESQISENTMEELTSSILLKG